MKFTLIDRVIEQSADRIVAVKHVSLAEEYLGDHFPGFPVLPGVLMLEAMVQAARLLLTERAGQRLVLGGVNALKYGSMVRPGDALAVEVSLRKVEANDVFHCRGTGTVLAASEAGLASGETAVSGRFTMRPIRGGSRVAQRDG